MHEGYHMTTKTEKTEKIDYASLGLKCGLELHQQLETGRKLFCHCKSELRLDEPQARITRHMRPTLSDHGRSGSESAEGIRVAHLIPGIRKCF